MKIGLVGAPSSGKSTFFKAATLAEVEISSRPFTTISSKEGVAYIKINCIDKEFNTKCNPKDGFCLNNKRFAPIKLIDVPGLIKGSHLGKGMGSKFLSDLNQTDILIHVVDISGSTNEKGEQITPLSYDPLKDIEFLEEELDMWYLNILKKGWNTFVKKTHQEKLDISKAIAKQMSGLKVNEDMTKTALKELNLKNITKLNEENLKNLSRKLRKSSKPMIIACNKIDIKGAEDNYNRLTEKYPELIAVKCSTETELALREAVKKKLIKYIPGEQKFEILNKNKLTEEQKKGLEFIKNYLKKNTTGIQEILNKAVLNILKYIAVFPVVNENKLTDTEGRVLPDVYLLQQGSTALDLAYQIHNDIGSKFIGAIDVRTKKRLGKDYIIKNRDVLKIMTS